MPKQQATSDHKVVFEDLVSRGYRLNTPGKLITLYPQAVQEAVLYGPIPGITHPLHIHHVRSSLRPEFFQAIAPFITRAETKTDPRGWDYYDVVNWKAFHEAVLRYDPNSVLRTS